MGHQEVFCRLVPHDEDVHGPPGDVLPLIAQVQEHKASTPVRPCLDYRCLNDLLTSQPGRSALVCEDTLHKWRRVGDPDELRLLDIRKAYLQVHIAPELQRFQTVLWQGKVYVMTRIGLWVECCTQVHGHYRTVGDPCIPRGGQLCRRCDDPRQ